MDVHFGVEIIRHLEYISDQLTDQFENKYHIEGVQRECLRRFQRFRQDFHLAPEACLMDVARHFQPILQQYKSAHSIVLNDFAFDYFLGPYYKPLLNLTKTIRYNLIYRVLLIYACIEGFMSGSVYPPLPKPGFVFNNSLPALTNQISSQ